MKIDVKKYSKLIIALISAGVISASMGYLYFQVKLKSSEKDIIYKSTNEGKFLTEKIGKEILMLGQDYLIEENLSESNFNKLMESKSKFEGWLLSIESEPGLKEEATALRESWKDLSDQLSFLNNFYGISVKSLSNPVEAMMVSRKNRAFLITDSNDNLPNDGLVGAENTIENQRVEYNSPLKQTLKVQIEKAISSYKTNSDSIMKTLDALIEKSSSNSSSIHSEAIRSYIYLVLSSFALMLICFLLMRGTSSHNESNIVNSSNELDTILNNVREGMFTMSAEWEILGNISTSLGDLLNKEFVKGDNFFTYIKSKVDNKTAKLSNDYLKLLIEKNLTEKLVSSVNPLKRVNVSSENYPQMVSISLSPIKVGDKVKTILVTISDVSEQKILEDKVNMERNKSSNQFEFLLKIMQSSEQSKFIKFFQKLQEIVCEQNEQLKTAEKDEKSIREVLLQIQHSTHTLKAEASALSLDMYQEMLHSFEERILQIKKKESLVSEDMHILSFFHKDMLEKTGGLINALDVAIKNHQKGQLYEDAALVAGAEMMLEKPQNNSMPLSLPSNDSGLRLLDDNDEYSMGLEGMEALNSFNLGSSTSVKYSESLLDDLNVLIKNNSKELDKKVNISLNLTVYDLVDDQKRDKLRSIIMHLINNSVTHGIETVIERERKNKYPVGVIQIFDEMQVSDDSEMAILHVVDDGAGLDLVKIKERAEQLGFDTGSGESDDLLPLIFLPDFSTNESTDMFSGRGIGLSVVKNEVEKMGGNISVKMSPGNYIEFLFTFNIGKNI